MIRAYRYVPYGNSNWQQEREISFETPTEMTKMLLGSKANSYLLNLDMFTELQDLIMDKLADVDFNELDMYISEMSRSHCLVNIVLLLNGQRVVKPFSVDLYGPLDALEFLMYTLSTRFDINLYVAKSFTPCRTIEELDEHYEIGEYVEIPRDRFRR